MTANTLTTSTPTISLTETVAVAPPADVILSPAEPQVRRHLWCELEGEATVHRLDDCFYVCENCGNEIRHVINDGKALWAIR